MLFKLRNILVVIAVLLSLPVIITPLVEQSKAAEPTNRLIAQDVENNIRKLFNNDPTLSISAYQDELLEISLGANTFFATSDGKYLFAGPVIDIQSRQNITELKARDYRAKRIGSLHEDMYLSYPASSENHSITLFTDIDCGYCRQFHQQMQDINAQGITVNYIMLPRAGLNSRSFNKTLSVLCSANPQKNMTLAMLGQYQDRQNQDRQYQDRQYQDTRQCQSTLPKQLELALELGISTTPSIILPDGQIKQGLLSTKQLTQLLNKEQNL